MPQAAAEPAPIATHRKGSFFGRKSTAPPSGSPGQLFSTRGWQVGGRPHNVGTPSRKNDKNFSNHFLGNILPQTAKTIL
jgi:hypothetical protein